MAQATDRVLVIGAGLAGVYAALHLAPRPVLLISPEPLGRGASSAWAQGGVAAAMAHHDSAAAHAADTLRAGAGTVDADVAALVTGAARGHIHALTDLGAPFDRDAAGGYVLSREAAHAAARVVRVKGDQAGHEIMQALIAHLRATPSVQVMEGVTVRRLEVEAGRVTGVWLAAEGAAPELLHTPAVLLAAGGAAGLYAMTTNPPRIRGQALGLAARAGAEIADAEFVQFHPTAIDMGEDPAPLATEALRGEGATLINRAGERFMCDLHPDAELAPRDVVARAVFAQWRAGMRPMLDARAAIGTGFAARFPAVHAACLRAGIDPATQPIPVAAAAHYHMGGVATDLAARSSLPGLWVVGEAAATGLHGANRLASNGLLEALVFAERAAADIRARIPPLPACPEVSLRSETAGDSADPSAIAALRRTMTEDVGVIRNAVGLRRALRSIAALEAGQTDDAFLNMTAAATLIAAAALAREESRGAHCRDDFPQTLADLARRSRMRLTDALAIRAA